MNNILAGMEWKILLLLLLNLAALILMDDLSNLIQPATAANLDDEVEIVSNTTNTNKTRYSAANSLSHTILVLSLDNQIHVRNTVQNPINVTTININDIKLVKDHNTQTCCDIAVPKNCGSYEKCEFETIHICSPDCLNKNSTEIGTVPPEVPSAQYVYQPNEMVRSVVSKPAIKHNIGNFNFMSTIPQRTIPIFPNSLSHRPIPQKVPQYMWYNQPQQIQQPIPYLFHTFLHNLYYISSLFGTNFQK